MSDHLAKEKKMNVGFSSYLLMFKNLTLILFKKKIPEIAITYPIAISVSISISKHQSSHLFAPPLPMPTFPCKSGPFIWGKLQGQKYLASSSTFTKKTSSSAMEGS